MDATNVARRPPSTGAIRRFFRSSTRLLVHLHRFHLDLSMLVLPWKRFYTHFRSCRHETPRVCDARGARARRCVAVHATRHLRRTHRLIFSIKRLFRNGNSSLSRKRVERGDVPIEANRPRLEKETGDVRGSMARDFDSRRYVRSKHGPSGVVDVVRGMSSRTCASVACEAK